MLKFKIPIISLSQYALDIPNNTERIIESIKICKRNNILYRPCNELELSGNNCNDHFLELDFIKLCYKYFVKIITNNDLDNIVYEIGMPFLDELDLFNCIFTIYNKKIIKIRPKIYLANSSNYRESRYFKNWNGKDLKVKLPRIISDIIKQEMSLFSDKNININGISINQIICEEFWNKNNEIYNKNIKSNIIFISNASEFEINKEKLRIQKLFEISNLNKNIYIIYNNLNSYDGDRMIFDGNCLIVKNNKIIKKFEKLGLWNIALDYIEIEYEPKYDKNSFNIKIKKYNFNFISNYFGYNSLEKYENNHYYQYSLAMSCYLYNYLKNSKAKYFILALSGGSDSATVASTVHFLSYRLYNLYYKKYTDKNPIYYFKNGTKNLLNDLIKNPNSPQDITNKILITIFLSTKYSTDNTRDKAIILSKEINSIHYNLDITNIFDTFKLFIENNLNHELKFLSEGGSYNDDITLQNLQARIRLICTYLIGQSLGSTIKKNKFGLVLSTGNLDEIARGYFTKYDNSSGDLGILASLNKTDVKELLKYYSIKFNIKILFEIEEMKPTAELQPITDNYKQNDENDMEIKYKDIEYFTNLMINDRFGLISIFKQNINKKINLVEFKIILKKYFDYYCKNRHKTTILPPSVHLKSSNLDDNRYNFRPIIYPNMNYIFEEIDDIIKNNSIIN